MEGVYPMKMTEQEIWRPVKDYEGLYEVSNFGRVRSLTRKVKTSKGITQTWIGQMLTPGKSGNGYYYVTLSKNGKSKSKSKNRRRKKRQRREKNKLKRESKK